jgi:adenosylcobalamin-dependent ribonucleoside-triphosphate reductase
MISSTSPTTPRFLDIADEDRFQLSKTFLSEFVRKEPDWGPVGYVTYKRTYARPRDGHSEEWWETCARVVEGVFTIQRWHSRRYHLPWSEAKARRSANEMYRLMFDMKFLPPGRGLWMMGTEYVERNGGAALNNCAFVSTENIQADFAEPFLFLMDMSMLGVGVGGDTRGAGTVKIVNPQFPTEATPFRPAWTHVVADTRQGWLELLRIVLDAYTDPNAFLPNRVDYSQVRPAGQPIRGFGGISAGPEPLRLMVDRIEEVLSHRIGSTITSSDIVDLFNIIGACVVSGNVRRSAEIMLGDPADAVFAHLKDDPAHPWRWASNNSILAEVGQSYDDAALRTGLNGEPGYFWLDNARSFGRMKDPAYAADWRAVGTNPCSEQTLESYELCCLVETFPSRHEDALDYQNTLKYAYLYAKTVTLIPTHNQKTNAVMLRNRRIGASMSGIVEAVNKFGTRTFLHEFADEGYQTIRNLDDQYSDWLAVPRSIKVTSVKPSGTVSLLPGVTPGIHFPHSEYYYRTIRVAKNNPLLNQLHAAGYRIEDDVVDALGKTAVVYFPVHEKNFARSKDDVTMWEQLELVAQMQYHWADNQVSATVTFTKEESGDIAHALELYESRLKSISFLPLEDHGYAQAPYITISKEEYEDAASKIVKLSITSDRHDTVDAYCDGDRCELPRRSN